MCQEFGGNFPNKNIINMNLTEDWQTDEFRQNVISKINEILQGVGQEIPNVSSIEDQVFRKSKSKQEYLSMVNKLFMHFKDFAKRNPQQQQQQQHQQQQQNMNQGLPPQNMVQNPLNALENLATQGNRSQNMPMQNLSIQIGGQMQSPNILQTLHQQRPVQQMSGMRMPMGMGGMGPGMQPVNDMMNTQMGNPMVGNNPGGMQMNPMANNPMVQQGQMMNMTDPMNQMNGMMPNQMQMNHGMQMVNTVSLPMSSTGGMQMSNNPMNMQPMQQMNPNQMTMGMSHQQMNPMMNVRMNHVGAGMNVVNNQTPRNLQGMSPQMQPSPSPMQAQQQMGNSQNQVMGMNQNIVQPNAPNQMLNMLCNMPPRPQTPLPQPVQMFVNRGMGNQQQFVRQNLVPTGPQVGNQQLMQNNQGGQPLQLPAPQMVPSPALVSAPSPQMPMMQPHQRNLRQPSPGSNLSTPGQISQNSPFNPYEEHLYREKYKQLTKYIEPLKRMVARIGNDDAEKITKMSKLLQILCNPSERVPLETLLKCEKALEKMEPCLFTGPAFTSSNPLLEVLTATMQSSFPNYSLSRTYKPCLDLLFGSDISGAAPPKKPKVIVESKKSDNEVPHVLQGEIARLASRFKVSLDSTHSNSSKTGIRLICYLDDERLPSLPPFHVLISEKYPWTSPECVITDGDYEATPFLQTLRRVLVDRIGKLPKLFSLSQLLDVWEVAVRIACTPDADSSSTP